MTAPAGRQGAAVRPPTPAEIAEVGRIAGLSGLEAGRLLGVSSRQWRRWLAGECAMPPSTYQWLLVATGLHPDYGPRSKRRTR